MSSCCVQATAGQHSVEDLSKAEFSCARTLSGGGKVAVSAGTKVPPNRVTATVHTTFGGEGRTRAICTGVQARRGEEQCGKGGNAGGDAGSEVDGNAPGVHQSVDPHARQPGNAGHSSLSGVSSEESAGAEQLERTSVARIGGTGPATSRGWRGSRLKSCLTPVPVMFQLSRRRLSQSMAYVWKRHKMA